MKTINRPNDLTGHICQYCMQPIDGLFIEVMRRGQRWYSHVEPCDESQYIEAQEMTGEPSRDWRERCDAEAKAVIAEVMG